MQPRKPRCQLEVHLSQESFDRREDGAADPASSLAGSLLPAAPHSHLLWSVQSNHTAPPRVSADPPLPKHGRREQCFTDADGDLGVTQTRQVSRLLLLTQSQCVQKPRWLLCRQYHRHHSCTARWCNLGSATEAPHNAESESALGANKAAYLGTFRVLLSQISIFAPM
jgi:hypothetical protein